MIPTRRRNLLIVIGVLAAIALLVGLLLFPAHLSLKQGQRVASTEKGLLVEKINRFASALQVGLGFSGVIGVAIDGAPIFERAYGLASPSVPNTTNTKFSIASLSKQFTAYAVLLLAHQGSIQITDAIENYVHELKGKAAGKVTIVDLLNHTSGLPSYFSPSAILHAQLCSNCVWASNDVVNLIAKYDRLGPRGKFVYSDVGYELLRVLIERITGQQWSTYLRNVIFQPYTLSHTDIYVPAQATLGASKGYIGILNPFTGHPIARAQVPTWNYSLAYGASGIYSTVGDLLRWGQILNSKQRSVYGDVEHMSSGEYVAGWMKESSRERKTRYYSHYGAVPGFSAAYYRIPELRLIVVVLSNEALINSKFNYGQELLHLILGEDYLQPGKD